MCARATRVIVRSSGYDVENDMLCLYLSMKKKKKKRERERDEVTSGMSLISKSKFEY